MISRIESLKRAITVSAFGASVNVYKIGLQEFMELIEQKPNAASAELCGDMLMYFCVEDCCHNGHAWPVLAASRFMELNAGCNLTDAEKTQAMKDMKTILNTPPIMRSALVGWANSHFS